MTKTKKETTTDKEKEELTKETQPTGMITDDHTIKGIKMTGMKERLLKDSGGMKD